MLRTTLFRGFRGALCVAVSTGTLFAAEVAQAQTLTPGEYTPDQARSVFVDAGYDVSPIRTWDWAEPPVSVFRVEDTRGGRVLLVQVEDTTAAAQMAEQRIPTGYTSSTWMYNLALFEATQDDSQRLATMHPDTPVDREFTDLLEWGSASGVPSINGAQSQE